MWSKKVAGPDNIVHTHRGYFLEEKLRVAQPLDGISLIVPTRDGRFTTSPGDVKIQTY